MDENTETSITLESLPTELWGMIASHVLTIPSMTFSELRDWHLSDDKAERQKACLSLLRTSKKWQAIARETVYANMTIHDELKFWRPSFPGDGSDFVVTEYQKNVLRQFQNPYFIHHSLEVPKFQSVPITTLVTRGYADREHRNYELLGKVATALNRSGWTYTPNLQSISTGSPPSLETMKKERLWLGSIHPEEPAHTTVFMDYLNAFVDSSGPQNKNVRWYCYHAGGTYAPDLHPLCQILQHDFNGGVDLPDIIEDFSYYPPRPNVGPVLPTSGFLNGVTNRIHPLRTRKWRTDPFEKTLRDWGSELRRLDERVGSAMDRLRRDLEEVQQSQGGFRAERKSRLSQSIEECEQRMPLDGTIIDLSAVISDNDLQKEWERWMSPGFSDPQQAPDSWKHMKLLSIDGALQDAVRGSRWEGKIILRRGLTDTYIELQFRGRIYCTLYQA